MGLGREQYVDSVRIFRDGGQKARPDPDWRLTPAGVEHFEKMATEHEEWLNGMFAGLGLPEQEELYRLLGHMRSVLAEG